MKRCSKCGETKPLEEFYGSTFAKDGRQASCKACWRRMANQRYRTASPSRRAEIIEKVRVWQQQHPEAGRANHSKEGARRRMRRMGLSVRVELVDLQAVFDRDGGRCGICGEMVGDEELEFDHVISLRDGGGHTFDNLQVAHRLCNRRKG